MNRHQRRKAAALARGRRTGYLHRVLAAFREPRPGLHICTIEHDYGCAIYRGHGCDCVPNVSVSNPHGGVTVVDADGNTTKVRKQ